MTKIIFENRVKKERELYHSEHIDRPQYLQRVVDICNSYLNEPDETPKDESGTIKIVLFDSDRKMLRDGYEIVVGNLIIKQVWPGSTIESSYYIAGSTKSVDAHAQNGKVKGAIIRLL